MVRHEFKESEVEALLKACHRRCCLCHRFCGVKIEIDHIEGAAEPGSGKIDNAIALCFDCHAEVKHYDPNNPKGRRFRASELKGHRDQWLGLCRDRPEMFVHAQPPPEAGSLERLLSELEFNRLLAGVAEASGHCADFEVTQFRRAISDGTFIWLPTPLKAAIHAGYMAMWRARADAPGGQARTESAVINDARQAGFAIEQATKILREAI